MEYKDVLEFTGSPDTEMQELTELLKKASVSFDDYGDTIEFVRGKAVVEIARGNGYVGIDIYDATRDEIVQIRGGCLEEILMTYEGEKPSSIAFIYRDPKDENSYYDEMASCLYKMDAVESKYIVCVDERDPLHAEPFDTLKQANDYARKAWSQLTSREKKEKAIYVVYVEKTEAYYFPENLDMDVFSWDAWYNADTPKGAADYDYDSKAETITHMDCSCCGTVTTYDNTDYLTVHNSDNAFLGRIFSHEPLDDWALVINGACPICDSWEDGNGHTCTAYGWELEDPNFAVDHGVANLVEAGWTAEARNELKAEHKLSDYEADAYVEALKEYLEAVKEIDYGTLRNKMETDVPER